LILKKPLTGEIKMSESVSLESFLKTLLGELNYENDSFSVVDKEDKLIDQSILFKNTVKSNYYLFLFINSISELNLVLDNQAKYFYLLKEFFNELQQVDKNTSMIIFLPTTEVNYESMLLEEDPYYFKKYILPYTPEQFNRFSKEYSNQLEDSRVKNILDQIISDVDLFDEFKSNPADESVFNFVSKLFVKIPVLKFPINMDKDVYNLDETIINSLNKDDKLLSVKHKVDYQIYNEQEMIDDDGNNTKIIEALFDFYNDKEE